MIGTINIYKLFEPADRLVSDAAARKWSEWMAQSGSYAVGKQSSRCIWPNWSPIKQGTDITQQSRPCKPSLDLQPRHVTLTFLAFRLKVRAKKEKKKAEEYIQKRKLWHLILSLHSSRACRSTVEVHPRSRLLRCWVHDLVSAGLYLFGSRCGKGVVKPFKGLLGYHMSCLKNTESPVNTSTTIIYQLIHLSPL